jgi:hypothetical protein
MRTSNDVGRSAPQLAGATQRNNTEAIDKGRDASQTRLRRKLSRQVFTNELDKSEAGGELRLLHCKRLTRPKKVRPAFGGRLAARDPVWDGEGWGCDRVA